MMRGGTADNNVIRYNLVHDHVKGGSGTSNDADGIQVDQRSTNNEVYGNVVYGNAGACITNYDGENTRIYNNTCYGNQQNLTGNVQNAEFRFTDSGVLTSTNLQVKNNIVKPTGASTYAIYLDGNTFNLSGLDITNNIINSVSANWYYLVDAGGNNLETWNGLTGIGTDLLGNPLFTDVSESNFTLLPTSPAVDGGINLGTSYQLGVAPTSSWPSLVATLNHNSNGSGWDMGAFVYPSETAPATQTSNQTHSPSAQSGGSSNSSSNTDCGEATPTGSPDLFQIATTRNEATLYFAPPGRPYSSFYIVYSSKPNAWEHGAEYAQGYAGGVLKYTINLLQPNKTYYFKVRAGNGCKTGDWSNTMMVRISGLRTRKVFHKNVSIPLLQPIGATVRTNKTLLLPLSTTPPVPPAKPDGEQPPQVTTPQQNPAPTPTPKLTRRKHCLLWWCL